MQNVYYNMRCVFVHLCVRQAEQNQVTVEAGQKIPANVFCCCFVVSLTTPLPDDTFPPPRRPAQNKHV